MAQCSAAATACMEKMKGQVSEACIKTFARQHRIVSDGSTGTISDKDILPVEQCDALVDLVDVTPDLLKKTVMLKLNGGLGTGMGLHDAKTLLPIKGDQTFLDFMARQVNYQREQTSGKGLRFMLLDSFNTTKSTRAFFAKYPSLAANFDTEVEILQNQVPKIYTGACQSQPAHDAHTPYFPACYPENPSCEWAPPGHGDVYTALYGSGKLDALIAEGYEYMFVSNGDNLGATLDSRVLNYMAKNKVDFLMEVAKRTASDKKGGHLAETTRHDKRILLLREAAQCPKEEESSFQDIHKYKYFNTNNLWLSLPALKSLMDAEDGVVSLPVIRNEKTLNPTDSSSCPVFQLETAMGAAIELFEHAAALLVPRERFAPVKTCADLLALRSDAYTITPDSRIVLEAARNGVPPVIDLDSKHYKFMSGFEDLVAGGVPSLLDCDKLSIKGRVHFGANVVIRGTVAIENSDPDTPLLVEDGRVLENETLTSRTKKERREE